jgi:hypothetical protein
MPDYSLRQVIVALDRIVRSLKLCAEEQKQQSEAIREYAKAQDGAAKPNPPITIRSEVQIPPEVIQRHDANQADQSRTQTRGYWVSFLTLIVLSLYTAFTGLTICEIRRQNSAVSAQVGIMQKQLEATDRPWVTVEPSISSPLVYNKSGLKIDLDFAVANTGRSPANRVWVSAGLVPGFELRDWWKKQDAMCDDWQFRIAPYVLFPGAHFSQPKSLQLRPDEIDPYRSSHSVNGSHDVMAMGIVGCVGYIFESRIPLHKTGFMFGKNILDSGTKLL